MKRTLAGVLRVEKRNTRLRYTVTITNDINAVNIILGSKIKGVSFERYSGRKSFTMIKEINDRKTFGGAMDIFDILAKIKPSSVKLFNEIKNNRDPKTNISFIARPMTNYEKRKFSSTLSELKKHDVVRRVPKSVARPPAGYAAFMLSPDFIFIKNPENSLLAEPMWRAINDLSKR